MSRARPRPDLYALLGVAPSVDADGVRQAFRRLALRHHPDVAGQDATSHFQLLTEAYRVLSDPEAREGYDAELRARDLQAPATARSGPVAGRSVDEVFGLRRRRSVATDVLARLAGSLDDLLARAVARRCADGVIELLLTTEEADRGGTLVFDVTAPVTCPTCGGSAAPGELWCARCTYAGTIQDAVSVEVPLPPGVSSGAEFTISVDPIGRSAPLRLRVRRAV